MSSPRSGTATVDAPTVDTAVVDIDGTLVDTNYHHALAWYRAFRRFDVTLPVWQLHRAIGMGGDQLVTEVAGARFEDEHGDDARAAWGEEFEPMLAEVRPFGGVRELLAALHDRGCKVVLASSGAPEHVDAYLDLFDGRELADAWTTSEDVDRTKPAPDLLSAAVERVDGRTAILIGDSVWDFRAAEQRRADRLRDPHRRLLRCRAARVRRERGVRLAAGPAPRTRPHRRRLTDAEGAPRRDCAVRRSPRRPRPPPCSTTRCAACRRRSPGARGRTSGTARARRTAR